MKNNALLSYLFLSIFFNNFPFFLLVLWISIKFEYSRYVGKKGVERLKKRANTNKDINLDKDIIGTITARRK